MDHTMRLFEACLRWTARGLSLALVGLVLLIFIGEGGVDFFALRPIEAVLMVLMLGTLAAMLVAWRWERLGGLISAASMIAFLVVELAASGNPARGMVPYLMVLPGLLFAACGAMRIRREFREPLGPSVGRQGTH